ncbi:MAG: hypothetical protein JNK77_02305 [Saprospiraceae bacterium]|nr:hypothetical protein [Saprospiraceae bacterium]
MKKLLNSRSRRFIVYCLSLLMFAYTTSCHFFKVKEIGGEAFAGLITVGQMKKTFILHFDELDRYILKDIAVKEGRLTGKLEIPSSTPIHYKQDRSTHYKNKTERSILQEVHIYLSDSTASPGAGANLNVPIANIEEIHVIDPATGRTVLSYVGITLGIIVAAFLAAGFIIALFKSSCPYVYVNDGQSFSFAGEIYGGAVQQNLERHDYLPLPYLQPVHNTYQLRITNELKEHQFTDLAELVVVEHPQQDRVLLDRHGTPQRISNLQLPSKALTAGGQAIADQLNAADGHKYLFNEEKQKKNSVTLTFPKPQAAQQGKLVINAKNTLWFDYLVGEFNKKFGGYYDTWVEKQGKMPTEQRVQEMQNQEFPITVSLRTPKGWQVIDRVDMVGPMANRDIVVPIDISAVRDDEVTLRLETGFLFWELDYAAMDFSENKGMKLTRLLPSLAMGSDGQNYTATLSAVDNMYLSQYNVGDVAEIHYPALPPDNDFSQSYFLHAKGYYQPVRDYKGPADVKTLKQFKNPGHFSEFSKQEFSRVMQQTEAVAKAK